MNILNVILSPYHGMQKVDFRPLTYIEVEHGKPLIIKLNDKFIFKTELQIANNFIKFNSSKNLIIEQFRKLNDLKIDTYEVNLAKRKCYKSLIRLLYEISKDNYKGFFAKRKYYKYLNNIWMKDTIFMKNVFEKVLDYNVEIKKKLENLQNIEIFKNNVSDVTAGGQLLKDLIEIDPNTGEKRFKH